METPINIHYYQGAYGPTIRLEIPTPEGLSVVRNALVQLAAGEATEYRLHEAPFVRLTAVDALVLKRVPQSGSKVVERARAAKGQTAFTWSNPPGEWTRCVGLLDGMSGTVPCHQYFNQEGHDDALIVVAYRESGEV